MADYCTSLEKSTLVTQAIEIADSASCDSPIQENSVINSKHVQNTPILERTTSDGLHLILHKVSWIPGEIRPETNMRLFATMGKVLYRTEN